ncbi:hypothetical protein J3L18_29620 [Mucilaginibacter gossypii]|uniref:hypothetical protein n=1 Tax=Mucilaginibacter gossypii TaxID=551996 RepID=UPI0016787F55|nr:MULTISPECIES: hypothetical protein [Mucilaginibacter]QTE37217.1 hypothetical protein J3L18_29620 [Mucilaginibacter gossypii]
MDVYVLIEHTDKGEEVRGVFNNDLSAMRREAYFKGGEDIRKFTIKRFTLHTQDMD